MSYNVWVLLRKAWSSTATACPRHRQQTDWEELGVAYQYQLQSVEVNPELTLDVSACWTKVRVAWHQGRARCFHERAEGSAMLLENYAATRTHVTRRLHRLDAALCAA